MGVSATSVTGRNFGFNLWSRISRMSELLRNGGAIHRHRLDHGSPLDPSDGISADLEVID